MLPRTFLSSTRRAAQSGRSRRIEDGGRGVGPRRRPAFTSPHSPPAISARRGLGPRARRGSPPARPALPANALLGRVGWGWITNVKQERTFVIHPLSLNGQLGGT